MSRKLAEGLTPNTVGKQCTLIKGALKDAYYNDVISKNPGEKIKKPKGVKPQHNFYTPQQLKTLLSAVKDTKMELPVVLAVLFGLRRSEVLGVKWSNIDFCSRQLEICNKITRQKSPSGSMRDVEGSQLKTDASHSVYYLNDAVCNYLADKRKAQRVMPRETDEYMDYVCVDEVGNLLRLDFITSKFNKILKENNLPHIRFHDLRHSCISLLANNSQFTMRQVQDYARHANFSLTADTYSHVMSENKLIELNAICDSLEITSNPSNPNNLFTENC